MFTSSQLISILILVVVFFIRPLAQADEKNQPFFDFRFLSVYQYKKNYWGAYRSKIKSPYFFLSTDGARSPENEYIALNQALSHPDTLWGPEKKPAACVYPLRKIVLEQISGIKFPDVICPDLDDWQKNLGADSASLVFAGAYIQNPASILGHSFLRLYNHRRHELLGYSVGYAAQTNPEDSKAMYTIKGLFGLYDGLFNIEPFYMNVGLYNNADARDLWEYPLKLNDIELQRMKFYVWELTQLASSPYYFFDENCSWQILQILKVVYQREDQFSDLIVLPLESIRYESDHHSIKNSSVESNQSGVINNNEHDFKYRASLQKKINYQYSLLSSVEKQHVKKIIFDLEWPQLSTEQAPSAEVLDISIEHFKSRFYEKQGRLTTKEAQLQQRALKVRESDQRITEFVDDDIILQKMKLPSPLTSHRPRSVELSASVIRDDWRAGIFFKSGVSGFWDHSEGYDQFSFIDYLGFGYEQNKWKYLIADVLTLNDFSNLYSKLSWRLFFKGEESYPLQTGGAVGWNLNWGLGLDQSLQVFALAQAKIQSDERRRYDFRVQPFWGMRWHFNENIESMFYFEDRVGQGRFIYRLDRNNHVWLQQKNDVSSLGLIFYF